MTQVRSLLLIVLLAAATGVGPPAASRRDVAMPSPPPQPESGYGGSSYPHAGVRQSCYLLDGEQYWLFEPIEPQPAEAPLVVFLHGWAEMNPSSYGLWIEHLVRRGSVVVYPRYQATLLTPPHRFLPHAVTSVLDAVARLEREPGRVRALTQHGVYIGHSAGGLLAAALAAQPDERLPRPAGILSIQPGKTSLFGLPSLQRLSPATRLLVVISDRDDIAGQEDGRLLHATAPLPPEQKALLLMQSDTHGRPALAAHHMAPIAFDPRYDASIIPLGKPVPAMAAGEPTTSQRRRPIGPLDHMGFWRLADELIDGATCAEPAPPSWEQQDELSMGTWSDGRPVRPLIVLDRQEPVPAAAQ